MKTFNSTAFALALSLGVLPGCGLLGRTVPNGYYGEVEPGVQIRPTDPSGRVMRNKPYWTVKEDGRVLPTDPSGRVMRNKPYWTVKEK